MYWLFDFTTNWGMHPFLALLWLLCLIGIVTVVFAIGACLKKDELRVKISNRFVPKLASGKKKDLYSYYAFADYIKSPLLNPLPQGRGRIKVFCLFLLLSFWISLINSLRIGWKDLDLGTWISQMHPKQITFETNGWMHTFLIMQSIIGKYFLVSFLLTFFGAPFNNW